MTKKTYSRLQKGRRIPTEYEIVSSDLHYNYPNSFELGPDNPVVAWYYEYREGSPFQATDWEAFSDPRATTYRAYTELQDRRETVIDGLLEEVDDSGYDDQMADGWIDFLDQWYFPLRYPVHGLEMLAAYVAQMAPASRITNCGAFQAADEMRRLQRIAYRTAQVNTHRLIRHPEEHRTSWEDSPPFQPLRELIEKALVTYDWGEAFVALNVVIKPHVDRLINQELAGAVAQANHDPILQAIHFSLDQDARWHRDWSRQLVQVAIDDSADNAERVGDHIDTWTPPARAAIDAFVEVFKDAPVPSEPTEVAARISRLVAGDAWL